MRYTDIVKSGGQEHNKLSRFSALKNEGHEEKLENLK